MTDTVTQQLRQALLDLRYVFLIWWCGPWQRRGRSDTWQPASSLRWALLMLHECGFYLVQGPPRGVAARQLEPVDACGVLHAPAHAPARARHHRLPHRQRTGKYMRIAQLWFRALLPWQAGKLDEQCDQIPTVQRGSVAAPTLRMAVAQQSCQELRIRSHLACTSCFLGYSNGLTIQVFVLNLQQPACCTCAAFFCADHLPAPSLTLCRAQTPCFGRPHHRSQRTPGAWTWCSATRGTCTAASTTATPA